MPGKVTSVRFSKDGSTLAVASGVTGLNGSAFIYSGSGKLLGEFKGVHKDLLYDAEISPDGKWLATCGYDRKIVLWNVQTKKPIHTLEAHNGAVYAIAFSPDGKVLASAGGDSSVKVWHVETGKRLDTLPGQPEGEQFDVGISNSHIVAVGADKRIRVWKWVSKDKPAINPLVKSTFAHEDEIVRLRLDGHRLITASADLTVKTWKLPNLESIQSYENQPDTVTSIANLGSAIWVSRMDGSYGVLVDQGVAKKEKNIAEIKRREIAAGTAKETKEAEPNDDPVSAKPIAVPAKISGVISKSGDVDTFRFEAKAGQEWVLEVNAARNKSMLDSKVSVVETNGDPIENVRLQAVRSSWLTFRGKNSSTSGDFRVHNWRRMELNQYLYVNGEVVKLWLYPRGPYSGFTVYPGTGNRRTYYNTSPMAHPLGQPCYIVEPLAPGEPPEANGLPVFPIYFENDDESNQRFGKDSQLFFTAPRDGAFVAKIQDVRGDGGEKYRYHLTIRPRKPDFKVQVSKLETTDSKTKKKKPKVVNPGSGKEFGVSVQRFDGFEGEVKLEITGIPEGFKVPSPIIIQEGQNFAKGMIYADLSAKNPEGDAATNSKVIAHATILGKPVKREVGTLGKIVLGPPAKLRIEVKPSVIEIRPGETVSAMVKLIRTAHKGNVAFGKEESGRNLPHGVIVDNIGLNGLLILQGQDEREFFLTASPWIPAQERVFHLRTGVDGEQTSQPLTLKVIRD